MGSEAPLHCYDCGQAYKSPQWVECVVPDSVWAKITPTGHEGGLLCVQCIANRCVALGIETNVLLTAGALRADALEISRDALAQRVWTLTTLLRECADELDENCEIEGRLSSFIDLSRRIRTALNDCGQES